MDSGVFAVLVSVLDTVLDAVLVGVLDAVVGLKFLHLQIIEFQQIVIH